MSVLKARLPPLVLLLLSKHPRGKYDSEPVFAIVSDQPACPAAASHVAWSSIHPYPWSTHVPEVTTGYTVVCARHTRTAAEASSAMTDVQSAGGVLGHRL